MNNENTIYLAYGSNLNLEQMAHRCPYATILDTAELPDYRLVFRGADGCAVANIEPHEGGRVPVLLWDITPRDEEALDRYEGWPRLYRKETLEIQIDGRMIPAMAYIMNEGPPLGAPGEDYLGTIREGYESAGFDEAVLKSVVFDSCLTVCKGRNELKHKRT